MATSARPGLAAVRAILSSALLATAAAKGAGAQQPVPVGGEFQVNTETTGRQGAPAVAGAADGSFVVVWHSSFGGYGIQGQRFAADGVPAGAEFQVSGSAAGGQFSPAVAGHGSGGFVVAWESFGSSGDDDSETSVQARLFSSDGSPLADPFQVNTYTTGFQSRVSIAVDGDGDFVVVWGSAGSGGGDTSGFSVQGQRFASNGSPQGGEFQVNTYTTDGQFEPSVSMNAAGDFVVAWRSEGSNGTDSSGASVQARRYGSDGVAVGSEFQVNTETFAAQFEPAVALDPAGGFVVAWANQAPLGFYADIALQRYASDGSPLGGEVEVNTYTTGRQDGPWVAADEDGGFIVTWASGSSPGTDASGDSVQARRYDSDGGPAGGQFQVNSFTTGNQGYDEESAVSAAGGGFVVVWASDGSSGTDSLSYSVQGQRYADPAFRVFLAGLAEPAPRAERGAEAQRSRRRGPSER